MGNSPAIAVTVTLASVPVDLSRWDINPKSGSLPLNLFFEGYMFRQGVGSETLVDSVIVDNEPIQLQILMPGTGVWADVGPAVTTRLEPTSGNHGYFSGTLPLTYPQITPGDYQFRVRYAGNPTKGLEGCDDGPFQQLNLEDGTLETPGVNPLLILGALGGAAAIYFFTQKKK